MPPNKGTELLPKDGANVPSNDDDDEMPKTEPLPNLLVAVPPKAFDCGKHLNPLVGCCGRLPNADDDTAKPPNPLPIIVLDRPKLCVKDLTGICEAEFSAEANASSV